MGSKTKILHDKKNKNMKQYLILWHSFTLFFFLFLIHRRVFIMENIPSKITSFSCSLELLFSLYWPTTGQWKLFTKGAGQPLSDSSKLWRSQWGCTRPFYYSVHCLSLAFGLRNRKKSPSQLKRNGRKHETDIKDIQTVKYCVCFICTEYSI